jgi:hypothetical protein
MVGVGLLIWLLPRLWPALPVMHNSQTAVLGWTSTWEVFPNVLNTVVVEDLVVVALSPLC